MNSTTASIVDNDVHIKQHVVQVNTPSNRVDLHIYLHDETTKKESLNINIELNRDVLHDLTIHENLGAITSTSNPSSCTITSGNGKYSFSGGTGFNGFVAIGDHAHVNHFTSSSSSPSTTTFSQNVGSKRISIRANNVGGNVSTLSGDVECQTIQGNASSTSGAVKVGGNIQGNASSTSGHVSANIVHGKMCTISGNIHCGEKK